MDFKRPRPAIHADSIVPLPDVDSGLSQSLVRVHNSHVGAFRRRTPVLIRNQTNKQWTIRYIVGSKCLKGITKTTLGLDYDAFVELGIDRKNKPYDLLVQKANFLQVNLWIMRSPDAAVKYGALWGVVGTVLGIVGLIGMF